MVGPKIHKQSIVTKSWVFHFQYYNCVLIQKGKATKESIYSITIVGSCK